MSNAVAQELKSALADPRKLCAALGLANGWKPQAGSGVSICCPVKPERTPSCSVTVGPDGTARFRCFGCGATGDALTLVAAARGLSVDSDFKEVLEAAAELAGRHDLVDEIRAGKPRAAGHVAPRPALPLPPERSYPPESDVDALWAACVSVTEDEGSSFALVSRLIEPEAVARADLARTLVPGAELPGWARYQGRSWYETGHRMILPVYDDAGKRRSVRAWRVTDDDSPKRLPPSGHKATGLVLANKTALKVLRGELRIFRLIVVEGEPDALVRFTVNPEEAVVGIFSGSWHEGFARAVPYGSEVIIRTHQDDAGEKYAKAIADSVRGRAVVRRATA